MKKQAGMNRIVRIALVVVMVASAIGGFAGVTSAQSTPTARIDRGLLNLIDECAVDYYKSTWNLTLDQYKAWIATIAWAESNAQYTAHSLYGSKTVSLNGDRFNHVVANNSFRFSTGIGPFQMDSSVIAGVNWSRESTINKLDPVKALRSVLQWHYDKPADSTLHNFTQNSPWLAVRGTLDDGITPKADSKWREVTGTNWYDCCYGRNDSLNWTAVANNIGVDRPLRNVLNYTGRARWNVRFKTEAGKNVSFNGYYDTWLVSVPTGGAGLPAFQYYYTYDDSQKYELWVWNNIGQENEFRYAFGRNYSEGRFPGNRTYTGGYKTTDGRYIARAGYVFDRAALDPYDLQTISAKPLDIVLITDRSGSMSGEKIIAAKNAAALFVDLLGGQDRVGLVSFESSATLDCPLSSDFSHAKSVIAGCSAGGSTNMGDALNKSINELVTNGRKDAICPAIYLTDGQTNTGLTKDEILNSLVPEAAKAGIFIYTLGYGSDVDPEFLTKVAEATGGKYYFAPNRAKLREIYIEISQQARGMQKVGEYTGSISQGETKIETFWLKLRTLFMRIFLIWPGSDLDLRLIDPSGNPVVPGPGVIYSGNHTVPEYYEIYNPQPGEWTIEVYGRDVTDTTEGYTIMIFQPGTLMRVEPTTWEIDFPANSTTVFVVSEVAGIIDLEDVVFTASDLVRVDAEALLEGMSLEAEVEERGEMVALREVTAQNTNVIPANSFSFTPNSFTVLAAGSQDVKGTLIVPRSTPVGDYSGTIEVTSSGGTMSISVIVHVADQPAIAVGGKAYPINKSFILAPWIALALGIAVGVLYLVRRRVYSRE